MHKRREAAVLFLITIFTISLMVYGCGKEKQKEATGVGEPVKEEVEETPQGNLEISKVSILKFGEGEYVHYRVVFFAGNNTDMLCKASDLTTTLYNNAGQVVGNQDGALGPVLPPGRWVASDAFYDVPSEPVRAEVNIRNLDWQKITESTPKFQTIQASWAPDTLGYIKVLGKFDYQGPDIEMLKILAILLDAGGQPVGIAEGYKDNVSAGSVPFGLDLGETMSQNIAKVEMAFIW